MIDNLCNTINNNDEDQNLWLTPFINSRINNPKLNLNRELNQIFVLFPENKTISAINLWNYNKNFDRGVKDVEIFLDERMIFKGEILPARNKEDNLSTV